MKCIMVILLLLLAGCCREYRVDSTQIQIACQDRGGVYDYIWHGEHTVTCVDGKCIPRKVWQGIIIPENMWPEDSQ